VSRHPAASEVTVEGNEASGSFYGDAVLVDIVKEGSVKRLATLTAIRMLPAMTSRGTALFEASLWWEIRLQRRLKR
jgi:hypothetical protein